MREPPRKGQFLTGDHYPADPPSPAAPRRVNKQYQRGDFLTSTIKPAELKRAHADDEKLARDYPHFEVQLKAIGSSHVLEIERQQAAIAELVRRFEAVRAQLKATKR